MNSTDSPIFSVDTEYCYTSFNRVHAAVMKAIYNADIEVGKSMLEYQTMEEDRIKAQANIDRALRGERFTAEDYSGEETLSRRFFECRTIPSWASTERSSGTPYLPATLPSVNGLKRR